MTGLDRAAVLGKRVWDVFPQLVGTDIEHWMKKAAADRIKIECESYYEPWDKWLLDRYYPSSDGGLTVFITDITERKRSDQAIADLNGSLAQRLMELHAIFDAAPVGINVARSPVQGHHFEHELLPRCSACPTAKTSPRRATHSRPHTWFSRRERRSRPETAHAGAGRGEIIEGERLDIVTVRTAARLRS